VGHSGPGGEGRREELDDVYVARWRADGIVKILSLQHSVKVVREYDTRMPQPWVQEWHRVIEAAKQKKAEGNVALAAGQLDEAMDCYEAGQGLIARHCRVCDSDGGSCEDQLAEVAAALKNNTALALLRMAAEVEASMNGDVAVCFYSEAAKAAAAVLELDPRNNKARARLEKAKNKMDELSRGGGH
jgi:tetratricopeptide (TPR) repeat protein